jgi:protein subunit release factor A
MATTRLHVWLIDDATNGGPFLADVWAMLLRIAHGAGYVVTPTINDAVSRWADIEADCHRVLVESGVHRAQYVPPASSMGRIETCLVGVEVVRPGEEPTVGRPSGAILKTYNYPQRRVTVHSTGQQTALDAVLAGQAGPQQ